MDKIVSVIGLGKLGLPLACCLAEAGFNVIGIDKDKKRIEKLNHGISPIEEPGLDDLWKKVDENISFANNVDYAVGNSQVLFVIVPTPSLTNGKYDMKYVKEAIASIGEELREQKNEFRVIDIVSTVLPGDIQKIISLLERVSGKKCAIDFGVCYNPEFIALGNVIKGIFEPDFVMIGESDARSGKMLESIYKKLLKNDAPIVHTNIENAELAKISLNVFVTMKIAYAEMLAEVCEKLPGCDVDEVTKLVGMDSRIGQKYLKAGLSYGGPCFPRDNRAFSAIAGDAKVLSEATDDANLGHGYFIRDKVHSILGKVEGKTISILGLTYKPDTNIVDDSGSLYVTNLLSDAGAKIKWYDPSGIVKNDWFKAKSIEDCLKDSELAIIATPWKEFLDLLPDIFLENMKVPRILDCWRIYNPSLFEQAGVDYYCVGRYGY